MSISGAQPHEWYQIKHSEYPIQGVMRAIPADTDHLGLHSLTPIKFKPDIHKYLDAWLRFENELVISFHTL